ncbi:hypothetical protein JYK00_06535 [Thermosipho ferrireducens]|uniref:Outer membrane protein beta-barrel domain-containing protein n=1 Tax=Thermosipho ferrireducens TaxID=2571116 RepID=A0ABX7S4K2_9BACT|nr:hypothetical protein [Thermosipho ferrireducens]QTA37391.1 hypothetical protein JYK00_06535 [Thermosipho ferrireducens]
MKKTAILFFVTLIPVMLLSSSFDMGAGWNFGSVNAFSVIIGYSDETFSTNWIYSFQGFEKYNHRITFSYSLYKTSQLKIGPMLFIENTNFSSETTSPIYELGITIKISLQNLNFSIGMGYPISGVFNFSEAIHIQARYFIPPPKNMKMRDKLYLITDYSKSKIFVGVGLLEPIN